ncbi:MAG: hypothetical protein ACYC7A_17335 [Thermoanaerobaculia bacterium]
MSFWPTVDDERRVALADDARSWGSDGLTTAEESARAREALATPYRSLSLIPRIAMFFVALLFSGALFAFFDIVRIPFEGLLTAAIAIVIAEVLIRKYRLFQAGVEEGLWVAALWAAVFDLPGEGSEKVILLLAAATLFAAIRTLSSYLGVLAIALVVIYIAVDVSAEAAGWTSLGIGAFAAAFFLRPLARPSLDLAVSVIAAIGAPAGYLFLLFRNHGMEGRLGRGELAVLVLFLAWFALAGIRPRVHPSLFAALALLAALLYESFSDLQFSTETDLILGGTLALLGAIAVDRALRGTPGGVTSRPIRRREEQSLLESVAAAAAAPVAHTPGEDHGRHGGGGGFGGGGASGEY